MDLSFLTHNQLIAGGAVLGLAGSVVASLRDLPKLAFVALKRRLIFSVDIHSGDALFYWFKFWLNEQPSIQRARAVSASTHYEDIGDDKRRLSVVFSPAEGDHLIRHHGRRMWLSREVKQTTGYQPSETITIKCFSRDQHILRNLFREVEAAVAQRDNKYIEVWITDGGSWKVLAKKTPRALDTVFLPDGAAESIADDLRNFIDSESWYIERGLPYRRGYLLHGPPGQGKSSTVSALAGEFKRDLYVLNLAARDMDDNTLAQLMMRVPPNGLLLIEDVDAAFTERDKSDEHASHVTFSGLLNALDGVGAKDGQIVFLSTNHIDRLDPALIRPGRIDYRLHLGEPTADQIGRLFAKFFPMSPLADAFAEKSVNQHLSMAAIQSHLLLYRSSDQAAVAAL